MNIRPSFLKTFLAVAHHRNVTRAATDIHLAQSSVSDQIQLLESELGTSLFIRSRRGLDLTPAGEVLLQYAGDILALMDEAQAAVEAAVGQPARRLTLGALETIAAVAMPPWLGAFRARHPGVSVQLKVAGSAGLLQQLESGGVDIAFCFDKGERDRRFAQRTMAMEPLVLITNPNGRTAAAVDSLGALATMPFMATEAGCVYRHLFDKAFAEAGITVPRPAAEVDSIRTITRLVAAGAGLALLPRLAVALELARGELVEISWPGPTPSASLVAVWRRRRVQPQAVNDFLAVTSTAPAPLTPGDDRLRHGEPSLS